MILPLILHTAGVGLYTLSSSPTRAALNLTVGSGSLGTTKVQAPVVAGTSAAPLSVQVPPTFV